MYHYSKIVKKIPKFSPELTVVAIFLLIGVVVVNWMMERGDILSKWHYLSFYVVMVLIFLVVDYYRIKKRGKGRITKGELHFYLTVNAVIMAAALSVMGVVVVFVV